MKRLSLILFLLLAAALACGESTPAPTRTPGPLPTIDAAVVPRRARMLEIDVNTSENDDYDAAIALAQRAGAQSVPLSIFWDDIETAPYEFKPDPNWLAVANAYYPAAGMEVSLTIGVLDTTADRRPPDLRDKPYDDPEVITRFAALLDYIAAQTPNLRLTSLAIGNEVDGLLGNHADAWAQYTAFFEQSATHARTLWPDVPLGAKAMFTGARA